MAKRSSILLDIVRLVLPLAVIGLGVWGMQLLGTAQQPAQGDADGSSAALVETALVTDHNGEFDIVVDGAVVPYRQVDIPAEVDGQIAEKNPDARAGRFVTGGMELIQIESRDYDLEVARIEQEIIQQDAAIAEARIEIENNLASVALAEEEVASQANEVVRYEGLVASGAAPETRLEEQRQSERQARIQLQTLTNQGALYNAVLHRLQTARQLNEIELERAQLDLERTTIKVPDGLNGIILEDNVELHSYVRAGDVLMRIVDSAHAEVRCSMRVDQLYWLWTQDATRSQALTNPNLIYEAPQTSVSVSFSVAGATYEWDGVLSRYEGSGLDPRSRTVPCRVLVEDPRGSRRVSHSPTSDPIPPPSLVSGMFVQVSVHTQTEVPLIAIPEQSLRPGNRVWLVRDGKLAVEEVEVVQTVDHQVLLRKDTSPLRVGDQVVVSPLSAPYPGMEVALQADASETDNSTADMGAPSDDDATSEESADE